MDRMPELEPSVITAVAEGRHANPHSCLGQHEYRDGWIVRALRPLATTVTVIRADGERVALQHVASGLWQGRAGGAEQAYELEATYPDGSTWTADDPYRFTPTVGDVDLFLFGEGRHEQLWEMLGAHVRRHESTDGTAFSVWAPNALAARVIGEFNAWDGAGHAMRRLDDIGVWELFVPGLNRAASTSSSC